MRLILVHGSYRKTGAWKLKWFIYTMNQKRRTRASETNRFVSDKKQSRHHMRRWIAQLLHFIFFFLFFFSSNGRHFKARTWILWRMDLGLHSAEITISSTYCLSGFITSDDDWTLPGGLHMEMESQPESTTRSWTAWQRTFVMLHHLLQKRKSAAEGYRSYLTHSSVSSFPATTQTTTEKRGRGDVTKARQADELCTIVEACKTLLLVASVTDPTSASCENVSWFGPLTAHSKPVKIFSG